MKTAAQKEVAIQCLEKLGIYKPYINKFKSSKSTPCFFENYGGFWADQEPELMAKIKEVEEEYGCWIYAITHEYTNLGETWSMLCVPRDNDGADDIIDEVNPDSLTRDFYAFSYVWNKSDDYMSEFGDIVVRSAYGGLKRIG
jgi:hypothetical protein